MGWIGKKVIIKLCEDDDEYTDFNNKTGIVVDKNYRFYSVSIDNVGTFLFTVGELQLISPMVGI